MSVLVDTSVWSLALRRRQQDLNATERLFVNEFTELVREGRAKLIGLIRQELLSGIRTKGQFETLRRALSAFPDETVRTDDHEAAAQASNDCRAKGIVVSVVDILICTIAIRRNLHVFTTDPDFNQFSRVLPLELHAIRARP